MIAYPPDPNLIPGQSGTGSAPSSGEAVTVVPAGNSTVLFLCTGNAARSVMAECIMAQLRPDILSVSAGTLAMEGAPLGSRTRHALSTIGMEIPQTHRSHELNAEDVRNADLIVAMEEDHVNNVRVRYPSGSPKTATLRWLARNLPTGLDLTPPRIGSLQLDCLDLSLQGDVADPAEATPPPYPTVAERLEWERKVYVDCAIEIFDLLSELAQLIARPSDRLVS